MLNRTKKSLTVALVSLSLSLSFAYANVNEDSESTFGTQPYIAKAETKRSEKLKKFILKIDETSLHDDVSKTANVFDMIRLKQELLNNSNPVVTTKPTPVPTPDPTPTPPPVTEAPTPEPPPVEAWYPGQGMSMYDVEPGWDGQLKWGCRTEEQMAFTVYCMKEALNRSNLDAALQSAIDEHERYGGFEANAEDGDSIYQILFSLRNNCSKVSPTTVAHEICNQHGVNFNDYYSNEGNAYYAIIGGSDCDGSSYAECLQNYYYWGYTTEFLGFADAEHAESRVKLAEGLWSISDEGCTERHTYEGNYYRDQHDLDMLKPYFDKYGIAY